jgi:hypothetical protein
VALARINGIENLFCAVLWSSVASFHSAVVRRNEVFDRRTHFCNFDTGLRCNSFEQAKGLAQPKHRGGLFRRDAPLMLGGVVCFRHAVQPAL